jgi:hypothetical protein
LTLQRIVWHMIAYFYVQKKRLLDLFILFVKILQQLVAKLLHYKYLLVHLLFINILYSSFCLIFRCVFSPYKIRIMHIVA